MLWLVILLTLLWYCVGVVCMWLASVLVHPVIHCRDVMPMLFGGIFGPFMIILVLMSLAERCEKPIRWLSLKRF